MPLALDKGRIALGIKQPWAELILQGIKTLEVRSQSTNVRGPIYLYTSQKTAREEFAVKAVEAHQLQLTELPLGKIVGSVELVDCRRATAADQRQSCVSEEILKNHFVWVLENPQRLSVPQPVRFLPYGVWFYPYQRRKTN